MKHSIGLTIRFLVAGSILLVSLACGQQSQSEQKPVPTELKWDKNKDGRFDGADWQLMSNGEKRQHATEKIKKVGMEVTEENIKSVLDSLDAVAHKER